MKYLLLLYIYYTFTMICDIIYLKCKNIIKWLKKKHKRLLKKRATRPNGWQAFLANQFTYSALNLHQLIIIFILFNFLIYCVGGIVGDCSFGVWRHLCCVVYLYWPLFFFFNFWIYAAALNDADFCTGQSLWRFEVFLIFGALIKRLIKIKNK